MKMHEIQSFKNLVKIWKKNYVEKSCIQFLIMARRKVRYGQAKNNFLVFKVNACYYGTQKLYDASYPIKSTKIG